MIPEISHIALLIGIVAGMIFYLDGWTVSAKAKELSESRRYRGLLVVISGGLFSRIIDNVLNTDKYDFLRGYLFGVFIGWLLLFISVSAMYVVWINTKDLSPRSNFYRFGQIAYSLIDIISGGIKVETIRYQRELDNQAFQIKLMKLKQRLRQEDPQGYIALEEQLIKSQQYALKNQKENLENLKVSINQLNSEPEQEAEKLIEDKTQLIQTLVSELELARNRYSEDTLKTQKIIGEYTKALRRQEKEIKELRESIKNFQNHVISQSEFSKLIAFKKITQYEFGGLFIGELIVNERSIRIYQGDITNLVTDIIVSSDDNYLSMGGGVSFRIGSVGGSSIYKEAQKFVPLSLGDVAITTAGKLSASKVFHGIVIDFDKRQGPSQKVIQQVIHTCLENANNGNYRSIAFPLLGTGAGGFPAIEALQIILSQVIKDLFAKTLSVSEIIIVIHGRIAQVIDVETIIEEIKDQL